jgi:hypothetical protein
MCHSGDKKRGFVRDLVRDSLALVPEAFTGFTDNSIIWYLILFPVFKFYFRNGSSFQLIKK